MVNTEAIKRRMKEKNIKQKDVATLWGIRECSANQKINGMRPMSLEEADLLSELLSIPLDEYRFYFLLDKLRSATR